MSCPNGNRDPHNGAVRQRTMEKAATKKEKEMRCKHQRTGERASENLGLTNHSHDYTSRFKSCNRAQRKILLSETASAAIRRNRSKGGSRNESKGANAEVQICNNSIITTENHSMLKCGCKANL